MNRYGKIAAAIAGAALLIMSSFSAAAEAMTSGDYTYEVQGGDLKIIRYNGEDEEILIPAEIEGKKVTIIGENSFQMNPDFISIEIPEGVTKIENHAFAIDKGMESVTIPSSVTQIEEKAFEQCESLKTINFTGDESTWNAITIADGNELLTAIKPNYNVEPTSQESTSSESESASSSETVSSAAASSETTVSSESDSSGETSSIAATTGTTTATESASAETAVEEPVPQSSGVNIVYVVGGILIGIAVLDIIYFSINKPKTDVPQETQNKPY